MADVCEKCIAANSQISGRSVTKMPNTVLFKTEPKINRQMTSAQLETKYTGKFDDPTYYG